MLEQVRTMGLCKFVLLVSLITVALGQFYNIAGNKPFPTVNWFNLIDHTEVSVTEVPSDDFHAVYNDIPSDILEELDMMEVEGKKVYYAGKRQDGDKLLGHGGRKQSWTAPRNVSVTFKYPRNGPGTKSITYLNCRVMQTSNYGKGYINGGGIGETSIDYVIEAYRTKFIKWSCQVYGM